MRVKEEHWAVLLDFCEQHPSIITNKFGGFQGRSENQRLWYDLTTLLNSLGYGTKTVEEWKKTLTDWKSKTKAKAGANNVGASRTGGGPWQGNPLTQHEERLLQLMGRTAVEGDVGVREFGIKRRQGNVPEPQPLAQVHISAPVNRTQPLPEVDVPLANVLEPQPLVHTITPTTRTQAFPGADIQFVNVPEPQPVQVHMSMPINRTRAVSETNIRHKQYTIVKSPQQHFYGGTGTLQLGVHNPTPVSAVEAFPDIGVVGVPEVITDPTIPVIEKAQAVPIHSSTGQKPLGETPRAKKRRAELTFKSNEEGLRRNVLQEQFQESNSQILERLSSIDRNIGVIADQLSQLVTLYRQSLNQ